MTSFEDHFLKEVVTDNGTVVWCRGVPPYTVNDVYAKYPKPKIPMQVLESEAGGTERKMYLPGTPEHDAWRDEVEEWQRITHLAVLDHYIDYGVVKWAFPWEAGETCSEPPKGWEPPGTILRNGPNLDDPVARRILFIKLCILLSSEDIDRVDAVTYSVKPVEKKDTEAAMVPTTSRSGDGPQSLESKAQ